MENFAAVSDELARFFRKNMPLTTRTARGTGIPFPYTVPSVQGFRNFFYWDTYFANWGLLSMGMFSQVRNNLLNMADFVERYGYIPNADVLLDRSQPPLFTRAVYDYAEASGDREIVTKLLPAMVREHAFWQEHRSTPCGLNRYCGSPTKRGLARFNRKIVQRIGIGTKELKGGLLDPNLLAAAESGWDFSSRYFDKLDCVATQICPVDLNAILYDAERKIAGFAAENGDTALADFFSEEAKRRAERMERYLYDGELGLFVDYDFVREERRTSLLHAGSFAAAAFGLGASAEGLQRLLSSLEAPFGLTVCAESEYSERFQWDYPFMWAPVTAIAVEGMLAAGLKEDALRIMKKYCGTVERNFRETGNLWEKYDAVTGARGDSCEYKTPPMLGWTAGVYLRFLEIIENLEI